MRELPQRLRRRLLHVPSAVRNLDCRSHSILTELWHVRGLGGGGRLWVVLDVVVVVVVVVVMIGACVTDTEGGVFGSGTPWLLKTLTSRMTRLAARLLSPILPMPT